eukprot:13216462-Alexandrium_andersonii.AAC.1
MGGDWTAVLRVLPRARPLLAAASSAGAGGPGRGCPAGVWHGLGHRAVAGRHALAECACRLPRRLQRGALAREERRPGRGHHQHRAGRGAPAEAPGPLASALLRCALVHVCQRVLVTVSVALSGV